MICRSCQAVVSYAVVIEHEDRSNAVYCGECAGHLVCVDQDIEHSREWRRIIAASPPIVRLGRR